MVFDSKIVRRYFSWALDTTREAHLRTLRDGQLFKGVSKKLLRKLLIDLIEKKYAAGDFIFHEGESGMAVYFVLEGSVKIIKKANSLASAGLWFIGINYPIMLGILTGVANVIPYFGPVSGCMVSSVAALMQYHSLDPVLNVVILYLGIKLMDDLVIQELIIGKSVHLHPMLLVITLIVGEKLFGIVGMILGVPVVTAGQKTAGILLEHHRETLRRESAGSFTKQHLAKSPVRPI
jgi:predicted PurR-regulated permease PerM